MISFTEVTALSIDITGIYEAETDVDLREELVNFAAHFNIRNISTLDINVWTAVYRPDEEEFHDYVTPVQAIAAAFPYLSELHLGGGEFEILNTIHLDIAFPIPDHYGIINAFAVSHQFQTSSAPSPHLYTRLAWAKLSHPLHSSSKSFLGSTCTTKPTWMLPEPESTKKLDIAYDTETVPCVPKFWPQTRTNENFWHVI